LSCRKNNIKKLPIQSLNLQNQPTEHEWRSVFCAEPGNKLICADYNQIEPRIMAQERQDSQMIGAYNSGVDLYKLTASIIFGIPVDKVKKESRERVIAKQITLGLCYGMAAPGLIKKLKSESNIELKKNEAELYTHKFKQSCLQITAFMDKVGKSAVKTGMVRNSAGRIRKFNPPTSSKERWGIERKAKNAVIQSLSADMTKIAMGSLFLRLEPIGVKFVNTVHDELVFETSAEQAEYVASIVTEEMIKAGSYYLTDLPCEVSITISDHWKK